MTQLTGLSQKVFMDRYSLKDAEGKAIETTPEEMWKRVAKGISEVEPKKVRSIWRKKFYDVMKDFKFLPGGRIFAGAGTGYDVTYYNCFVIPSPKDSRDGILDNLKSMIEIMARGGGVGLNLSSLRPRGARVKKVNGFSSGPINWAELYSLATKDIVQQGGCFAGDTRIMTHLGLVKIEDIVASKGTYFAETHKGLKEITAKFDNGTKEVFEIETKGGYKVKTTAAHKFLTFDKNGSFYLKPLSEFKIDEHLVLLPAFYNNDIPEVILRSDFPNASKHSNGRKIYSLPKTLTADLAFMLGVYATDGSRMKDKYASFKGLRFAVDAKRKKDLAYLTNLIYEIFGASPRIRKGDGNVMVVEVSSVSIAEFLHLNNLLKENSNKVFVPEQIFTSPQRVVEAFISGVFFGDGGNRGGKGGFRISSVNKKFLEDNQLLLLNLGIPSKLTVQVRDKWQDLYTLNINGARYMKRFFNIIAPQNEKAYDYPVSVRDGFYNFPRNILKRFAYLSGIQRTIAYTNPTTSYKTMSFIEESYRTLDIDDTYDAEILISTVTDSIKSITPAGVCQVYDLEVEDVHLLSGNGSYSSNSRRGALMLMLHDWHPDVEEFITVKQDLTRINGANLSVCLSDAFMEAVKKDADWDLIYPDLDDPTYDAKWDGDMKAWKESGGKVKTYKTIKASYLWDLICTAAWQSAEPGLHFLERSNKRSNTWYFENLIATNPCGEQPLSAWAVCNLGAMNLVAYIKNGKFDYDAFGKDVQVATRFLDDVIDATYYFMDENEKCAKDIRRTGLGIMGLGDALIMMKLRYGAEESLPTIEKIFKTLRDNAYIASADIAKEKGAFPKFEAEKYLQGHHVKALPVKIRERIAKYGIRNAVLLTIAPTGTTSLLAGTTSGIEPVYEFEFIRKSRLGVDKLYHPLYDAWRKDHPEETRPAYFVSANDLTPMDHAKVQAIAQGYIDSSISKTVNAPNNHTVQDVKDLYMSAYDMGMKGITYMRDGSRLGVLQREEKKEEKKEEEVKKVAPISRRPMVMRGLTYKTQTPLGDAFITINNDDSGQPFEMFITIGKSGSDVAAMADALGRIISLVLRLQSPIEPRERIRQIIAQMSGIGGMRSVGFGVNRVRSVPDAMAKVLAEEFKFKVNGRVVDIQHEVGGSDTQITSTNGHATNGNGHANGVAEPLHADAAPIAVIAEAAIGALLPKPQVEQLPLEAAETNAHADVCPECGVASFVHEEGCVKCYSCGHSEC